MPVQDVPVHQGQPATRDDDRAPSSPPQVLSRALDRREHAARDERDEEPPEEAGYGFGV